MLLDAFARVSRTRDAQLVILGNGPLQTELEARAVHLGIASRVRFEGYAADVGAWMRQATVFALPSQWEGFPNVLLEALAAGCPVVSTDCSDAVSEVLDGGRLGYIVPVGDTTAMADALGAVLDGHMCFEDAASHLARYDPSSIAARYLDILDRAAQGAH